MGVCCVLIARGLMLCISRWEFVDLMGIVLVAHSYVVLFLLVRLFCYFA